MRVLCISAHPDDVEIGMGGTVAFLTQKNIQVRIVDLTNGEPTPMGSPEIRATESARAAEILKAERRTLDMPNRYLEDTIENRKKLASEIRDFRPEYMFAPYFDDAHPDHIAASHLCDAARFYAKLTKSDIPGEPFFPRRIIYYFPVHIRLRVEPTFLLDISAHLETKKSAILCYQSQFVLSGKAHLIEHLMTENRYWGFQGGCDAAEPFFQKELPLIRWPEGIA